MEEETEPNFRTELVALINKYSIENLSDTPDFILGEYLQGCLATFNIATRKREKWYGRTKVIADVATQAELTEEK